MDIKTKFEMILERLIFKLTSAQFILAVVVSSTYCVLVFKALELVGNDKISQEFFFGLFAGFSTMVGSVVTFYYTRERNGKLRNKKEE